MSRKVLTDFPQIFRITSLTLSNHVISPVSVTQPWTTWVWYFKWHYSDVIMGTMASQTTRLTIVYSSADQRKHQSSASLAFVRGIHRWPVSSPHKWPITRKMFPFDDVIMSPPRNIIKPQPNKSQQNHVHIVWVLLYSSVHTNQWGMVKTISAGRANIHCHKL